MGEVHSANHNNSMERDYYSDTGSEEELTDTIHTDNSNSNRSVTDSIKIANINMIKTIKHISFVDITEIERKLDRDDIVGLVFLLEENAKLAIEILEKDKGDYYLTSFAHQHQTEVQWSEKLVEALCIVQNYYVLHKYLSFTRRDLESRFLPYQFVTSVNILLYRKLLYIICEKMDEDNTQDVLELIEKDFRKKKLFFKRFDNCYFELYLLEWERLNYINSNNLDCLYKVFKQLELFEICEMIKSAVGVNSVDNAVSCNESEELSDQVLEMLFDKKTSLFDFAAASISPKSIDIDQPKNIYQINPKYPGVCLIINQNRFYRETDRQYDHLLIRGRTDLETRDGSIRDQEILEITFKKYGYRTLVENDLTHLELLKKVEQVAEEVRQDSSLVVCIMSHGEKEVVYGSNSCKVNVKEIEEVMCRANYRHLQGKPKVLILQACQGIDFQSIPKNSGYRFDGPTNQIGTKPPPFAADRFTFWATVPGFRAIRHKNHGSWFIQSLCEKLQKLSDTCHFDDICTQVVQDVSQQVWATKKHQITMVPLKESTFTKQFYLPKQI